MVSTKAAKKKRLLFIYFSNMQRFRKQTMDHNAPATTPLHYGMPPHAVQPSLRSCSLSLSEFLLFFCSTEILPAHAHPSVFFFFFSNRHEHLPPPTDDEYPTEKQPDAGHDVDITRQLVGREYLRADEARPRALVRVDECAGARASCSRELRGGVVCGSRVGRCAAACHSWF